MKKGIIYICLMLALVACKKNKPPTIEIKSPEDGSKFLVESYFTIRAVLTDDEGLKEVKYTLFANETKKQLTGTSFLLEVEHSMYNGDTPIKIEVTDNEGATTVKEIKIYKK